MTQVARAPCIREFPLQEFQDRFAVEIIYRDYIANQSFISLFIFFGDDNCLPYGGALLQDAGYFSQFNPVATDLNLVVNTANEKDVTVGQEFYEVARSVQGSAVAPLKGFLINFSFVRTG